MNFWSSTGEMYRSGFTVHHSSLLLLRDCRAQCQARRPPDREWLVRLSSSQQRRVRNQLTPPQMTGRSSILLKVQYICIYTCIHAHMYVNVVCIMCISICTCVLIILLLYVCIFICVHAYIHMCTCVHMYYATGAYIIFYTYACACTYIPVYAFIIGEVYTCTYV